MTRAGKVRSGEVWAGTFGEQKVERAVRLYHYTSRYHVGSIFQAGELRPTESNADIRQLQAAPDAVWLYGSDVWPDPSDMLSAVLRYPEDVVVPVDKTEVRFTVDLPDAVRWLEWTETRRADPDTIRALIDVGDGTHRDWWVVERPVPAAEWARIDVRDLSPAVPAQEVR